LSSSPGRAFGPSALGSGRNEGPQRPGHGGKGWLQVRDGTGYTSELPQLDHLLLDINGLNVPAVESIHHSLCQPNGCQDQKLVLILDVDVEGASRVYAPVPLRFALQDVVMLGLGLKLDDQVLQQVRHLSGHRLSAERIAVTVVTLVAGEVRKKPKETLWNMRGAVRCAPIRVGHFYYQLDLVGAVEKDLKDAHQVTPRRNQRLLVGRQTGDCEKLSIERKRGVMDDD